MVLIYGGGEGGGGGELGKEGRTKVKVAGCLVLLQMISSSSTLQEHTWKQVSTTTFPTCNQHRM